MKRVKERLLEAKFKKMRLTNEKHKFSAKVKARAMRLK